MIIIVTLHLLLAVGFMLYFFHVPGNTEIHSKNVTVAPTNGTQLKLEDPAVTNSNGKRDSPEEAENSGVINKIDHGVEDTGDSGGTEESKEPQVQGKTSGSNPAPVDTGDSDAAIKTGTEDS